MFLSAIFGFHEYYIEKLAEYSSTVPGRAGELFVKVRAAQIELERPK